MSYTNYNQGNGYNQPNPFDQRYNDNPYQAQGTHSAGSYNDGGYQLRNDVEMQPLNDGQQDYNAPTSSQTTLDRSNRLREKINNRLKGQLDDLESTYKRAKDDPDRYRSEIDSKYANVMSEIRQLVKEIQLVKGLPDAKSSMNSSQIRMLDADMKAAMHRNLKMETEFQTKLKEINIRQYRIVNPEATKMDDEEIENKLVEYEGNIFGHALQQQGRLGTATSVLNNVKSRHEEIQKIEKQMEQLMNLFQDLEQAVETQAPKVAAIEQTTMEAHDNVVKGNTEIDGAIDKARSARRKKWWCLLIVVIILIIIAIIVAIVVTQLNK